MFVPNVDVYCEYSLITAVVLFIGWVSVEYWARKPQESRS
jgi:hypothetical protein